MEDPRPGEGIAHGRPLAALLVGILVVGVLERLRPLARFALWGSDTGEYVHLTERILDLGRIVFDYDGWGIAYPYFPGLFVLDGAVALFTGLEVLAVQNVLVPSLAGLLGLLLYLIAREIVPDRRVALVAGAFLAITAPHVLITTHAMPGTLGHILLLASIYALVRSYRDRAWAFALPVLSAALLLTHHLTLYFLVGAVVMIALLRELIRGTTDRSRLAIEVPLAAGLVAAAAVWWLGVAVPFREEIVGEVLDASPWLVAGLAIAVLAVLPPLAILLRRRFLPPVRTRPRWPSPRFVAATWAALFFGLTGLVALFLVVPLPGGAMRIYPATLQYLPPVAAFLAFAIAGGRVLRLAPLGAVVSGWLAAILASLAFAIATDSHVLFPFRHVEYFVEPLTIYAAAGVVAAADHVARLKPGRIGRAVPVAAIALVLLVGAVAALPPRETIANFEEGITQDELDAVLWLETHAPPGAVVAADHRLSSLIFGLADVRATFDYADETYHSPTLAGAVGEMRNLSIPGNPHAKITHVLLSPTMRAGVALEQFANAEPMSEAAQAKFENATYFRLVYPADGVRERGETWVLEVQWAAVDRDFPVP